MLRHMCLFAIKETCITEWAGKVAKAYTEGNVRNGVDGDGVNKAEINHAGANYADSDTLYLPKNNII